MAPSTATGGGGMHDPTQGDNVSRKPASSVAEQSRAAGIGAENINDFLDRQSPAILNRLYAKPASCVAIFRLLPMLARQLVMQMLFLDSPLKWEDWNAQLTKEGRR
jgi:transcription initiation factor TFIIH subunit 4